MPAVPGAGTVRGRAGGEPEKYPVKTRKLKRSAQSLCLLWAQKPDGSVWLEKRPATGIWGGLYCLPVFESDEALQALLPESLDGRLQALPRFLHVLTHKDLHLSPWIAGFQPDQAMPEAMVSEARPAAWFGPAAWPGLGLPAPIRKLLAHDAHGFGLRPERARCRLAGSAGVEFPVPLQGGQSRQKAAASASTR